MILVISILAMIMAGLSLALIYEKMDVTRIVVWSVISFVFAYIINSAFLFWIDRFSIIRTCIIVLIEAIVLVVILCVRKKKLSCSFDYKEIIVPVIVFLILLPVVFQKFGFFGMGQDQGVYQTKAIALIYGHNQNNYLLNETADMSDEQKEQYKDGIAEQYGFYYTGLSDNGSVQGVFHGINTYPAILAWWGSMFGYEQMAGVNTLILLCCIILAYDLGKLFGVSKLGRAFITMVFGLSPIILWVNKSSLSENITILIFITYLYLLFGRGNGKDSSDNTDENSCKRSAEGKLVWLAAIPVAVYAVFHVTIYVMMPLFAVVFFMMYFLYGNKGYLIANLIILAVYKLGHMMMISTAWEYTYGNYGVISKLGLDPINMGFYSTVAVLVLGIFTILLMIMPKLQAMMNRLYCNVWFRRVWNIFYRIVILGCAFYAYRIVKYSRYSYVSATMYAYVAATAVIIIPFILFILMFRTNYIYKSKRIFVLTFIYLYCGIFFATALYNIVGYYNYYSRYITGYLICIPLIGVVLLEQILKARGRKTQLRTVLYTGCMILVVVLYVRYDSFMIGKLDETRMEWSTLASITKMLNPEDGIIIDGSLKNQLFYTTKHIAGNKSYPVMNDLSQTMKYAKQDCSGNVYYITENELSQTIVNANQLELVLTLVDYEKIYNKEIAALGRLPYPLRNQIINHTIFIYKR